MGGDEEAEGGWREEGSLARRESESESALPLPRASSLFLSPVSRLLSRRN